MFCPIVNALFICKWALFVNVGLICLRLLWFWLSILIYLSVRCMSRKRLLCFVASGVYFNLWYPIFQVFKSISPPIPDFIKLWQTLLIAITASMPRLALFWQQRVKDFSKALIRSIFCLHSLCNKILSPWSRPP